MVGVHCPGYSVSSRTYSDQRQRTSTHVERSEEEMEQDTIAPYATFLAPHVIAVLNMWFWTFRNDNITTPHQGTTRSRYPSQLL